jgi:septal ring-binding cell division protein DamX
MARERAQFAPSGSWTLQVLFACEGSTVDNAFSDGGERKLMLFPASSGGSACYRLTWGVFPSRDAALAQAGGIPARFRGEKPVPLALSKAAGL